MKQGQERRISRERHCLAHPKRYIVTKESELVVTVAPLGLNLDLGHGQQVSSQGDEKAGAGHSFSFPAQSVLKSLPESKPVTARSVFRSVNVAAPLCRAMGLAEQK